MIDYPESATVIANIDGSPYVLCLYDFHVLASVDLTEPSRFDLLDDNGYLIGRWIYLDWTSDSDYYLEWLDRHPVPDGSAIAFDFSGDPVRSYILKNGGLIPND